MCGIIGILGVKNSKIIVGSGLSSMNYRGLDSSGILEINNNFCMGHCLHAVVNNIKQPISRHGVLVANCELYNWKFLSEKFNLLAKNDAEFLFELLETKDIAEVVELIDGDFACAYYKDNKLFLFRDIFGVKPLWYSEERGFAFASEKKVLESLGYSSIEDLSPRKILVYDLKSKTINFIDRSFFEISPVHNEDYSILKKRTAGFLINSISKRIPDCKFGLMFSGGVDSAFIAIILKQLGVDFECYISVVEDSDMKTADDLLFAEKLSKILDVKLHIIKSSIRDVSNALKIVPNIIESSNVTKVGVALPFYFCAKEASKNGCKVLMSGLGSEEIFGGYERHKHSLDVNKDCLSGLLWIYERDLYRDDTLTMANSIELRVPFLDKDLASYALKIPSKYKIADHSKQILRDIAFDLGLPKDFAYRKKKAAQYGSNFDRAIDRLYKRSGLKRKSNYLLSFYKKPNLKLGVLFSSGKDSCYAMFIMKQQNYSIDCLISISSSNPDSYMFQSANIDVVKLQSKALDIHLVTVDTNGEKEKELEDLSKALMIAKKRFGIQGVVTGALYSTYQRDRIDRVCDRLGLKVFSPLWHKSQEEVLNELISNNFEVIIVKIASGGLDKKWLGRKLDKKAIEELIVLSRKEGLNPAGEGGEFESVVLDAPLFKKKLKIISADTVMESETVGNYFIKDAKLVIKST